MAPPANPAEPDPEGCCRPTLCQSALHAYDGEWRDGDTSFLKAIKDMISYSAKLDDQTKARAEYWADGPRSEQPPGHWMLFAGAISRKNSQTIDQDAKLNFAVSNALLDAGIAAWNAKRRYDFIRPVTAVRTTQAGKTIKAWAGPGQGTKVIPAEQFRSYIPTPPSPDYVSGHSTFSAAAAQVIRTSSGSDTLNVTSTFAAGSSFVEPGTVPAAPVKLGWSTFSAAAGEAGLSREYGGIHFRDADAHGLNLGRAIGTNTWNKANTYFQASPPAERRRHRAGDFCLSAPAGVASGSVPAGAGPGVGGPAAC